MDTILTFSVILLSAWLVEAQFLKCDDDSTYEPEEGLLSELRFSWIGALQYIHVKNGTPHYFRVPRVILISRQYVLSTANDAAHVPKGYALGNVVFGEYERDEAECGLTVRQLAKGRQCEPTTLLVPLLDVLLHPEYKHFGATDSIALLKMIMPVKSDYMLPVCLPFKNFLIDKHGRQTKDSVWHIDFSSDVPRDFFDEDKELTRLNLLPREICYLYDTPDNATNLYKNRIMCTTGCGFHSGAPTLVHEHTGHWSVVAISQGGPPCPDPLRTRRPSSPPHHIVIYPYVPWITSAITGKALGAFETDDPFGFVMRRNSQMNTYKRDHDWNGHWWMGGIRCYDRGEAAEDLFRFYHEIFMITPREETETYLTYYLELNSGHDTIIVCVKVGMPYKLGKPTAWGLDTAELKVRIPVMKFYDRYKLQVEAWAYNMTESSSRTECKDEGDDC